MFTRLTRLEELSFHQRRYIITVQNQLEKLPRHERPFPAVLVFSYISMLILANNLHQKLMTR